MVKKRSRKGSGRKRTVKRRCVETRGEADEGAVRVAGIRGREREGGWQVGGELGRKEEGEMDVLPCPIPTDPAMGDKTPEVMGWYREYAPEEYVRRYGNRICPEVDVLVGLRGVRGGLGDEVECGPISDFEDEEDDVVVVKPRVIMG